jgi:hypothetical protein
MITKEQAMTAKLFHHVSEKNSDGTPLRVRRNGKTQTWKRDTERFLIPVKYGYKRCLYITNETAPRWEVAE